MDDQKPRPPATDSIFCAALEFSEALNESLAAMRRAHDTLAQNGFETDAKTLNSAIIKLRFLLAKEKRGA